MDVLANSADSDEMMHSVAILSRSLLFAKVIIYRLSGYQIIPDNLVCSIWVICFDYLPYTIFVSASFFLGLFLKHKLF